MFPTCAERSGTYSEVRLEGNRSVWLTDTVPSAYTVIAVGMTCTDEGRLVWARAPPTNAIVRAQTNSPATPFFIAATLGGKLVVNNLLSVRGG